MASRGPRPFAVVAHVRRVSAPDRERFAGQLRKRTPKLDLVLQTCHRVEAYGVGRPDGLADLVPPGGRVLIGRQAVRHAVATAVGLDSIVVGEDQVLHQLRETVSAARSGTRLDPTLDRLFAIALRAGRRARSWRGGPGRSLADVALDEAAERSGAIAGRPLLIVGAGKMGHLVAVAAAGRGARIAVASRTADRAERLAREVGGRAVPFDPGPAGLGDVSATVVALLGGWPIGRRTAAALIEGSFPIIDLSTMPVLPMRVRAPLGRRYVSADDLARPTRGVRSSGTDQRLLALVDAAVEEFVVWSAGHDGRTVASVLSARVDAVRRSELDALWQRESTVDSATREAVERMTRHLAERWLREPLERLGRDADGRQAAAARELFSL